MDSGEQSDFALLVSGRAGRAKPLVKSGNTSDHGAGQGKHTHTPQGSRFTWGPKRLFFFQEGNAAISKESALGWFRSGRCTCVTGHLHERRAEFAWGITDPLGELFEVRSVCSVAIQTRPGCRTSLKLTCRTTGARGAVDLTTSAVRDFPEFTARGDESINLIIDD